MAELPTFQIAVPIGVVKDGKVMMDPKFHRALLAFREAIAAKLTPEALAAAIATVNGLIDDVSDALVVVSDATTAATDAATSAQAATDANARFLKISSSTTTGLVITASDSGTDVTVNFSAHTRNYADGTSVAVNSGAITGLAYTTQYFFAYDQASLAGGVVTYEEYLSGPDAQTTAAGGAAPDRHYVGSVVTPAAAGGPTTGTQPVAITFDKPVGGDWL